MPRPDSVCLGVVDNRSVNEELLLGINRSSRRLTVCHPSALENILGVTLLGQVEAFSCTLDVDAEEKNADHQDP